MTENLQARMVWISKKVRDLRNERGLTQKALAELGGLRQSHISRLEAG